MCDVCGSDVILRSDLAEVKSDVKLIIRLLSTLLQVQATTGNLLLQQEDVADDSVPSPQGPQDTINESDTFCSGELLTSSNEGILASTQFTQQDQEQQQLDYSSFSQIKSENIEVVQDQENNADTEADNGPFCTSTLISGRYGSAHDDPLEQQEQSPVFAAPRIMPNPHLRLNGHARSYGRSSPLNGSVTPTDLSFHHQLLPSTSSSLATARIHMRGNRNLKLKESPKTGSKTYDCGYCHQLFESKYRLRTHIGTHHAAGEPHMCGVCGRTFNHYRYLKLHKLSHMEDRPYTCEMCGLGFSELTRLKRHVKIHSGMKEFACAHCGNRYNRLDNRNAHELRCRSKKIDTTGVEDTSGV